MKYISLWRVGEGGGEEEGSLEGRGGEREMGRGGTGEPGGTREREADKEEGRGMSRDPRGTRGTGRAGKREWRKKGVRRGGGFQRR